MSEHDQLLEKLATSDYVEYASPLNTWCDELNNGLEPIGSNYEMW